jgi:hypothetical protein
MIVLHAALSRQYRNGELDELLRADAGLELRGPRGLGQWAKFNAIRYPGKFFLRNEQAKYAC